MFGRNRCLRHFAVAVALVFGFPGELAGETVRGGGAAIHDAVALESGSIESAQVAQAWAEFQDGSSQKAFEILEALADDADTAIARSVEEAMLSMARGLFDHNLLAKSEPFLTHLAESPLLDLAAEGINERYLRAIIDNDLSRLPEIETALRAAIDRAGPSSLSSAGGKAKRALQEVKRIQNTTGKKKHRWALGTALTRAARRLEGRLAPSTPLPRAQGFDLLAKQPKNEIRTAIRSLKIAADEAWAGIAEDYAATPPLDGSETNVERALEQRLTVGVLKAQLGKTDEAMAIIQPVAALRQSLPAAQNRAAWKAQMWSISNRFGEGEFSSELEADLFELAGSGKQAGDEVAWTVLRLAELAEKQDRLADARCYLRDLKTFVDKPGAQRQADEVLALFAQEHPNHPAPRPEVVSALEALWRRNGMIERDAEGNERFVAHPVNAK